MQNFLLKQKKQQVVFLSILLFLYILPISCSGADGFDRIFESAYNYLIVDKQDSVVSFRRMENAATVSAIDLSRPTFQVVPYTRFLFAATLYKPQPRKVLSIGLGAGAFNRLFNVAYPAAELTTVEIDPMIEKMAEVLTGFQPDKLNRVIIEDGRRFLRHSKERWDWIIVDAYVRNSQTPPHLTTVEFFDLARRQLSDDGVLVVNLVSQRALYYSQIATLRRIFPNNVILEVPKRSNKVFLGTIRSAPALMAVITKLDNSLRPVFAENGVEIESIRQSIIEVILPQGTPILTDDFAPTEYLGNDWGRS